MVITELESHPHESTLRRSDTFFQELQCAASFGRELPDKIRKLVHHAIEDDHALEELSQALLEWNPAAIAKLSTTQAVDVISGAVKVNALPESAWAIVNHRIAEHRYLSRSLWTSRPSSSDISKLRVRASKPHHQHRQAGCNSVQYLVAGVRKGGHYRKQGTAHFDRRFRYSTGACAYNAYPR